MKGMLRSSIAVLVVLLGLLTINPVYADSAMQVSGSGNAIEFEDETPLEVVWPNSPVFVVLNNTTFDLQVTLDVSDFVLEHPVDNDIERLVLVQHSEGVFSLPATSRKPMSLGINQRTIPEPGVYIGWITLSTGQPAAVIRKSIRLSVPASQIEGLKSAQTAPGSAPPAVAAWTVQAYRLFPGMRPFCINNLSFACTLPVKVQNPPSITSAGTIGSLNGDNGGGLDIVLEQTRQNNAELGMEFQQAWPPVGSYNGTLDFLPDDDSAGEVALTVNVKDTIITPLLITGAGILLAQWAQFYLTVKRGVMQVERRLVQVIVDFEAVPSEVISGYTVKNDVIVQRESIEQSLSSWSQRHLNNPSSEDTERFKATVLAPLEKLENGIKDWVGFDAHLQELRKSLDGQAWPVIEKARPPSHLNLDAPRFYLVARTLLRGRPISLRDFEKRQIVIDEAIKFASLWGELDGVRATVSEALDFVSQYRSQLSETARHDLELARRKLSEAPRELWEAENLTRLRVLRTSDDLEQAKAIIDQLMGLIEVGPSKPESFVPEGLELLKPWSEDGGTFLGSFDMSVLRNLRARLWGIVPPLLKPADIHTAEGARKRIVWLDRALLAGDGALVGLAFLAAIVAGLKPYFTTNFGTLYDYLSAFTWGFGAKAAVEFINAAIEKYFDNA